MENQTGIQDLIGAPAYFDFVWPQSRRGSKPFDRNAAWNPFCGGLETPSSVRTPFPLNGGPVQLALLNWTSNFPAKGRFVYMNLWLALGNDVGYDSPAFVSAIQRPDNQNFLFGLNYFQLAFDKPGLFCWPSVMIPDEKKWSVSEGMNATLQIQTNVVGFDPQTEPQIIASGYQCADITFTSASLSGEEFFRRCHNDSILVDNTIQTSSLTSASWSTLSSSSAISTKTTTPSTNSTILSDPEFHDSTYEKFGPGAKAGSISAIAVVLFISSAFFLVRRRLIRRKEKQAFLETGLRNESSGEISWVAPDGDSIESIPEEPLPSYAEAVGKGKDEQKGSKVDSMCA